MDYKTGIWDHEKKKKTPKKTAEPWASREMLIIDEIS
jgi:hypothetical protein